MAQLLGDAFAGLRSTTNNNNTKTKTPEHDDSPHYHFLHSTLLPATSMIQKELRGRKYKEVHAKLGEAVMGMQKFQFETWPPKTKEQTTVTTTSTSTNGDDNNNNTSLLDTHLNKNKENNKNDDETVNTEVDNTDLESTMGDFSQAPEEDDDLETFDDVTATTETITTTTSSKPTTVNAAVTDTNSTEEYSQQDILMVQNDDPQTREQVHESIEKAIEAYILVFTHPQKTNRACELALDCTTQVVTKGYLSGRAGGQDDISGSGSKFRETPRENKPPTSLLHQLMMATQKCGESSKDSIQSGVVDCFKAIMTSPKCSVHEASMLLAIRCIFHIYLVTKSSECQQNTKKCMMDIVILIIRRMEESPLKEKSLFYADSYYLLRSLVKLSSKELQGIDDNAVTAANFLTRQIFTNSVDPLALNNKVLSLELICQIMECAGDNICYGEKFVHLVQSQLCVALLKNCMSNHIQVAFISQKTFLVLVYKFKIHLKDEIQVFITNIFLRVLQSENSSFIQKALVLESLRSLCNDPVLLTQIFLNYDCDFDAMNIYKEIVFHLTKLSGKSISQPISNLSKKDAEDSFELSLAAVEVLVTILHTFLKALVAKDNFEINDTAGKKIRSLLGLKEVGKFNLQQFEVKKQKDLDDIENFVNKTGDAPPSSPLASFQESSSNLAGQMVDAFDRKRNAQETFELGAVKFTLSIKDGLRYFIENGFVNLKAKEIAVFFLDNKDKLDKTQMGEVLGKEPDSSFLKTPADAEEGGSGFFLQILNHYVDAMDFTGLLFDEAIRLFLSGFRLPGEAQKIDRIMEKFAERYTKQNIDIFPNADTAFILAFSVIMLNTDLHNPSIKPERRMTLDGFKRNNSGIGENGSDLPAEFLAGIFQRIKESPFSLKEDDAAREKAAADVLETSLFGDAGLFGTSSEDRKREKFKKEREEMMNATEQLIRRRKGKANASGRSLADSVAPADVVKPMFDVTWGPVIGILSQILECSDDARTIAVSLNGFIFAIRISAHSNMSLARDTFINSLAKFTLLGSIKEMTFKNLEAIRTLMKIAVADGEFLGESWGPVLQCISQLARKRMSASGLDSDKEFLQQGNVGGSTPAKNKKKFATDSIFVSRQQTQAVMTKEMEEMNNRAILESFGEELIDGVFSSTVKLSARSLGHFIEQLVAVSKAELDGDTNQGIKGVKPDDPSIFSLQRLVEVADFNMDSRPRVIWTQVWEIMADYFAEIGCHRNQMISVFAIDSLKQLTSKFLEKPELTEFHFQRIFLKPFLVIIENTETPLANRELVLQCLDQMVNTKAHNLQSGWKIFFDILMVAARDPSERITILAINILQRSLDEHLSKLCKLPSVEANEAKGEESKEEKEDVSAVERRNRNSAAEDFVGMCKASLSFIPQAGSKIKYPIGVSMRALCHSAIYADLIAEKRMLPPVSGYQTENSEEPGYTYKGLNEKESLEMILWRPLFEGLADAVKSTVPSRSGGMGCIIQRGSVLAIRAILLRHGSLFSLRQIGTILRETIIPAFCQGAESDLSPVVGITSESPAISNLDFLVDAMPLPPSRYDQGLQKFEEVARSMDCAPKRPLGPAELLVEACFTDMRHNGDGDLSTVYHFALNKDSRPKEEEEQPFPDSWISQVAPVALGTVTDVTTEIILLGGRESAIQLWPQVSTLYQRWFNGRLSESGNQNGIEWSPCEALVRIACREMNRFSERFSKKVSALEEKDAVTWSNSVIVFFSNTLSQSLDIEQDVKTTLLSEKMRAFNLSHSDGKDVEDDAMIGKDKNEDSKTQNGEGGIVEKDTNDAGEEEKKMMNYNALDEAGDNEAYDSGTTWVRFVPQLKVRCVAAHFLHQSFLSLDQELLMPFLEEKNVTGILEELGRSRGISEKAAKDEDIAHAFQEAILSEWGMDDEDREEALVNVARLSQTQGSAMFFLTQTAGATSAMIRVLSALYGNDNYGSRENQWDHEAFAIPFLLEIMQDVFMKFAESEANERHRIDPNMMRNASESGIKVALYCTSFASVVVCLLEAMLSFDREHFERQKNIFFEMICRLITVQSDEIRELVQKILLTKFGPMLGVDN